MENHEIERRWVVPYGEMPEGISWKSTKVAMLDENKLMVRFRQKVGKDGTKNELTVKFGEGMDKSEFNVDLPKEIIEGAFQRLFTVDYHTCVFEKDGCEFEAKTIPNKDFVIVEKEFESVSDAKGFSIGKYFKEAKEVTDDFSYNFQFFYWQEKGK